MTPAIIVRRHLRDGRAVVLYRDAVRPWLWHFEVRE